MRTFAIETLGCKVNQYESQQIRRFLERFGLTCADRNREPDLVVVNTCCVTAAASAKSRQFIQRAAKLNPDSVRVICGCLPALSNVEGPALSNVEGPFLGNGELNSPSDKKTFVVDDRRRLAPLLSQVINNDIRPETPAEINGSLPFTNFPNLPQLTSFAGHTRAFLKVQDGCDGFCTYCVIPKVRPDVHSKSLDDVIAEAQALVNAEHKEIVITGVNLGAYGLASVRPPHPPRPATPDCHCERSEAISTPHTAPGSHTMRTRSNPNLPRLLDALAQIHNLPRIRLSSLDPPDVTDRLLDVFCAHSNIMPHIHLSVQSGCDNILRKMARNYKADDIRRTIDLIKSRLDRPAITSDIIVGFPTETDDDFQQTFDLANWAGFSKIHVFAFSPRPGTPAAKLPHRIPPNIIKHRSATLRSLSDSLSLNFRSQFLNQTAQVLLEHPPGQPPSGRSERYFPVDVQSAAHQLQRNDIVKVVITAVTPQRTTASQITNQE